MNKVTMDKNIFITCITIASFNLLSAQTHSVDIGPAADTLCAGECIQLDATVIDPDPAAEYKHTWQVNGSNDPLLNNQVIITVCPQQATVIYRVEVEDTVGGTTETDGPLIDQIIIRTTLPAGNVAQSEFIICKDSCVRISGPTGAGMADVYSWTPSDGLSDDSILNPLACPEDTVQYIVTTTTGGDLNKVCEQKDTIWVFVEICEEEEEEENDTDTGNLTHFSDLLAGPEDFYFHAASGNVYINAAITSSGRLKFLMTDVSGRIVYEKFIYHYTHPVTVALPDLKAGIYLLSLMSEDGIIRTFKQAIP